MLLEREAELSCIDTLLRSLATTGGRVVLIRGEAGIGKTSLVSEIVDRHAPTAHTLVGSCDDLLTPQTLGPLWDIARDEPAVAVALACDDPRVAHEAVFDLMGRSLQPTLLVLEDPIGPTRRRSISSGSWGGASLERTPSWCSRTVIRRSIWNIRCARCSATCHRHR